MHSLEVGGSSGCDVSLLLQFMRESIEFSGLMEQWIILIF